MKLKIAGAALNQTPIDWTHNFNNILSAINEAKIQGIHILCLPELAITGYGCEDLFLSDWVNEKALAILFDIIPHTEGIGLIVGLPFKYKNKVYNTVAIIENCHLKGLYAKHHLAKEGIHYEPRWFESWPIGKSIEIDLLGEKVPFGSFTTQLQNITCGFEICEDAWQGDRPICHFLDQKVKVIFNASASHFAFGKSLIREELVVKSSEMADAMYVYVNLLGNEAGRIIYDGDVLIGNKGQLITRQKRFSFHNYQLAFAELDTDGGTAIGQIAENTSNRFVEFDHAASLALFDYLRKSRAKGYVLSLSGGADSSCIATLVHRMFVHAFNALGLDGFYTKTQVHRIDENPLNGFFVTAYQSTLNSSEQTRKSAAFLANSLGARHLEWSIDSNHQQNIQTIQQAIGRTLSWQTDDIALQNIQARTRSPLIWMLANLTNSLLLTTSNRSEGSVGYATMDGDTSGSIAPIAGVSKPFILEWLRYAEKELGYNGLKLVNQLTPTAELRPADMAQTDEADLMPYEVLDQIERLAIYHRYAPLEVFDQLKTDYPPAQLKIWISKFYRLWSQNQWKRERIAPSFHFDDYNVDPRSWCRFPILSGSFISELSLLETAGDIQDL